MSKITFQSSLFSAYVPYKKIFATKTYLYQIVIYISLFSLFASCANPSILLQKQVANAVVQRQNAVVQEPAVETTAWQTTANVLPQGVANAAYATFQSGTRAYMYVVGGRGSSGVLTSVYYASMNTDGNIQSSWQTSSQTIPLALFGATAAIYQQGTAPYLYIMAGRDSDNIGQKTVYYAAINPATGDVGAWQTAANSLPQGLLSPTSALYQSPKNPYIYVVGGQDNQYTVSTVTYYAAINPATGDIGAWQTATNNLPMGINKAASVLFQAGYAAYMYVIGGNGSSTTAFDTVLYTAIDGNTGNIGPWSTSATKLPTGLYNSGSGIDMAGSAAYMYVLGGKDGSNATQRNVYYASLNSATGDISPFSTSTNMLPQAIFNPASGVYQSGGSSYLYMIGGQDANDNYSSLVYYAKTTQLPAANIQVDYTSPLRTINSLAFGLDETTYDAGRYLVNDPLEQQRIKSLHVKSMRVSLKYQRPSDPTSGIICEANGCDPTVSGDKWLGAIRAVGADPIITVPLDATDAANLVKHFNKDTNNYVGRWIVYNEPNNQGLTAEAYSRSFNTIYDAMKAVDPSIKIGGPALSFLDTQFLQTFLTISGSKVDFIDFHQYAEGAVPKAASTLLSSTNLYEDNINIVRNMLLTTVPWRASTIDIQLGEWYVNDMPGDTNIYQSFGTVWTASVLGHILRAGGLSYPYGTKNNFLFGDPNTLHGTTLDDPMPAYQGYAMFTGGGLFPPFGSVLVSTNTTLPNIEVYASDQPKSIIVINKDPSVAWTKATFSLGGMVVGKAEVWRKDSTMSPYTAPRDLGLLKIVGGAFTYTLPAYSVTTFILSPS